MPAIEALTKPREPAGAKLPSIRARLRRLTAHVILAPIAPTLLGLRFSIRVLPRRAALGLGRLFARLSRSARRDLILARRRAVLDPADDDPAFWDAHLDHVARTIIEPFELDQLTDEEIVGRVAITGEDHLRNALSAGRGVVLFVNHLGNVGAIVGGLGLRGYPVTIAGNRMVATVLGEEVTLRYVETEVQRLFRRGNVRRALLGENLPRRLAEALSHNECFGMFIDFPVVRKRNHRVAFGAAAMDVNLGPALLALRHDAPVLCVDAVRTGDNRHRLVIHPPLERPAGDRHEAAVAMLQQALHLLAGSVRDHAAQWWPWDWADIRPGSEA